jgi:uncharacterized protein YcgI (DUF1989 family)
MNVTISAHGELTTGPPRSKAWDGTVLRAEMNLIVGLTACPVIGVGPAWRSATYFGTRQNSGGAEQYAS